MRSKHLLRLAALVATGVATMAVTGLPWADASSSAHRGQAASSNKPLCITYDSDDTVQCLPPGPTGRRGRHGPRGQTGATGPTGPVGFKGHQGRRGRRGAKGVVGARGRVGGHGAFAPGGSDPGGNTVVVLGSKIGPIPIPSGPDTGQELTPSVARCPSAGHDQQAFNGGVMVTTLNSSGQPATGDDVGIEDSYPGIYAGGTEVDPLPAGSTPGAISVEPANAYTATAVITEMQSGDSVTVQTYVVCGP